jgi:predicted transcriptional regulator of viral defense system
MTKTQNKAEDILFQIASQQQGYFTTAQSIEAGYKDAVHPYHVKNGNWIREWRGIYRLSRYPLTENGQYALWSLWSRNRKNIPQGIYSHQTALSMFDLSDIMPQKLHMTVPIGFRRHSEIPKVLILHRNKITPEEIEEREGFSVTRPVRAIIDLIIDESVSVDIIKQAYKESKQRGLLQDFDFQKYCNNEEIYQKILSCIGEINLNEY